MSQKSGDEPELDVCFIKSGLLSSSSSSESWEHGQAPCYAHFDTRYAVGTHAAGWNEIKKFSSRAARGFYVS